MGHRNSLPSPDTFFHDPFPDDPLILTRLPSSIRLHVLQFHVQMIYLDSVRLLRFYGYFPPDRTPHVIFPHVDFKRVPQVHEHGYALMETDKPWLFLSELPVLSSIDSRYFWNGVWGQVLLRSQCRRSPLLDPPIQLRQFTLKIGPRRPQPDRQEPEPNKKGEGGACQSWVDLLGEEEFQSPNESSLSWNGVDKVIVELGKIGNGIEGLDGMFYDVGGVRNYAWVLKEGAVRWGTLLREGMTGDLFRRAREGITEDVMSELPEQTVECIRELEKEWEEEEEKKPDAEQVERIARIMDLYHGVPEVTADFFEFERMGSHLVSLSWTDLPFHPINQLVETSPILKKLRLEGLSMKDPRCFPAIASSQSLESVFICADSVVAGSCSPGILFSSRSISSLRLFGYPDFGEFEPQSTLKKLHIAAQDPFPLSTFQQIVEKLLGLRVVEIGLKGALEPNEPPQPDYGDAVVECFVNGIDRKDFMLQLRYDCGFHFAKNAPFLIVAPFWRSDDHLVTNIGDLVPYHVVLVVFEFLQVGLNVADELEENIDFPVVRRPIDLFGRFRYDVTRKKFLVFSSVAVASREALLALPSSVRHVSVVGDSAFPFIPPDRPTFLVSVESHIEMPSLEWLDRAVRVEHLSTGVQRLVSEDFQVLRRHSALRVVTFGSLAHVQPGSRLVLDRVVSLKIAGHVQAGQRVPLPEFSVDCPNLSRLSLSRLRIDDTLAFSAEIRLRALFLEKCVVRDSDFYRLVNLESLEELNVVESELDLDVVYPCDSYSLLDVHLKQCPVNEGFLRLLKHCPLRRLDLVRCGIRSELPLVEVFTNECWKSGMEIRLDKNNAVSADLIRDLKQARPDAKILWNRCRFYGAREGGHQCQIM